MPDRRVVPAPSSEQPDSLTGRGNQAENDGTESRVAPGQRQRGTAVPVSADPRPASVQAEEQK